jgi:hypothetical protein
MAAAKDDRREERREVKKEVAAEPVQERPDCQCPN